MISCYTPSLKQIFPLLRYFCWCYPYGADASLALQYVLLFLSRCLIYGISSSSGKYAHLRYYVCPAVWCPVMLRVSRLIFYFTIFLLKLSVRRCRPLAQTHVLRFCIDACFIVAAVSIKVIRAALLPSTSVNWASVSGQTSALALPSTIIYIVVAV